MNKKNAMKLNTNDDDSSEYKIKAIYNSTVYAKKLASHLLRLYYLVF